MILDTVDEKKKGVHTRYLILLIIFIVTAVNYADRATLSIAGTEVAKELQLSAVSMGYIFSAFGWAYLLMQIPGGWLLDKFGSKKVYTYSLFFWSLFTFLQGFVDMFPLAWAGISMFFMRFMLGFSEAPSFPANARIVAAWFPTKERGTASAIFNSAQYFSLALFSPLLGWLTFAWGWEHVFTVMGVIGFVLTALWIKLIHNPTDHPRMSAEELKFISENGAVVDMDHKKPGSAAASGPKLHYIKQLLSNRMMLGVFFGQYFINTITWFFLTWFPIYLVQEKGMSILKVGLVASIPALCGFAGGVLGMLLASTIILCNYTNNTTLVVMLMALAFFGKGFGALGWPVISDTAPKEIVGLCGGVFNVFGNVASIVTPLVIGYLVSELHSFNAALVFVGCSALMAMVCYLFVVGDIKRMELQK
ncbi:galactarate/glucarate/glycerate transporter GarP [Escherichia coli]